MKPRILLIAPRQARRAGAFYEFPLGLAQVAGCLRTAGFEVEGLNLNHSDAPVETMVGDAVRRLDINVAGVGGFSTHYMAVKRALDAAGAARSDIVKIAGGSLVSSEPALVAGGLGLDFGVVGEGEITIVELMKTLADGGDPADVAGLVFRKRDGGYALTTPRPPIADLDSLPYPDYDGFDIETYLDIQRPDDRQYLYVRDEPRFLYTVASRSCPYDCTFCFPMFGKRVRKRSLDHFFGEVDMLVGRYGVNILGVFDALFDTEPEFLKAFCDRMGRYDLSWMLQARTDSLDEERMRTLKDSGAFTVLYGLESASDAMLKKMKKASTVRQMEEALALSRRMGMRIMGEFIFGQPSETWETATETLEWWKKNNYYQIDMGHVYPFPGCADYRHCVDRGLIDNPLEYIEQGCRPVNMTNMDDATYRRLFREISDVGHNGAVFGEIQSIEKEAPDEAKGAMAFTMKIVCPHCGANNTYPHYHVETFAGTIKYPFSSATVTCRECNQAYSLRTEDVCLKCPDMRARKAFLKSAQPPVY